MAGLDSMELRREVEANPIVGEIVGLAWEVAAETASVHKRRLLARVAANALRGGAEAEVDAEQLLLRTVTALDSIHITLLVIIGRLEDRDTRASNAEERRAERAAMEAEWPSAPDLMDRSGGAGARGAGIQRTRRRWGSARLEAAPIRATLPRPPPDRQGRLAARSGPAVTCPLRFM
jgi:hypothetical protein